MNFSYRLRLNDIIIIIFFTASFIINIIFCGPYKLSILEEANAENELLTFTSQKSWSNNIRVLKRMEKVVACYKLIKLLKSAKHLDSNVQFNPLALNMMSATPILRKVSFKKCKGDDIYIKMYSCPCRRNPLPEYNFMFDDFIDTFYFTKVSEHSAFFFKRIKVPNPAADEFITFRKIDNFSNYIIRVMNDITDTKKLFFPPKEKLIYETIGSLAEKRYLRDIYYNRKAASLSDALDFIDPSKIARLSKELKWIVEKINKKNGMQKDVDIITHPLMAYSTEKVKKNSRPLYFRKHLKFNDESVVPAAPIHQSMITLYGEKSFGDEKYAISCGSRQKSLFIYGKIVVHHEIYYSPIIFIDYANFLNDICVHNKLPTYDYDQSFNENDFPIWDINYDLKTVDLQPWCAASSKKRKNNNGQSSRP